MPATAIAILRELMGRRGVAAATACFDINASCLGFVRAMEIAGDAIAAGRWRRVGVVAVDLASKGLDWGDLDTATLFGDGGAAAVLGAAEAGDAAPRTAAAPPSPNSVAVSRSPQSSPLDARSTATTPTRRQRPAAIASPAISIARTNPRHDALISKHAVAAATPRLPINSRKIAIAVAGIGCSDITPTNNTASSSSTRTPATSSARANATAPNPTRRVLRANKRPPLHAILSQRRTRLQPQPRIQRRGLHDPRGQTMRSSQDFHCRHMCYNPLIGVIPNSDDWPIQDGRWHEAHLGSSTHPSGNRRRHRGVVLVSVARQMGARIRRSSGSPSNSPTALATCRTTRAGPPTA